MNHATLIRSAVLALLALTAGAASARPVSFGNPVSLSSTFSGARDMAVADLDGDGDLDVVGVSDTLDDVVWWENGAGWAAHPIEQAATGVANVDVADIDGDGDPDVVAATAHGAGDVIFWWANSGDASSWTATNIASALSSAVADLELADIDRDGDPDLIVALPDSDSVWWWQNTAGDGSAWSGALVAQPVVGALAATAADLDGDGDLDVAIAASGESGPRWSENLDGAGGSWDDDDLGVSIGTLANDIAVGDVDQDGDLDLVISKDSDTLLWVENTAGDASAWSSSGLFDPNEPGALTLADVDRDGDLDVVGASVFDDEVRWWENALNEGGPWTEHVVGMAFDEPAATAVADLDGDGDPEIVAVAASGGRVAAWPNRDLHRSLVLRDVPEVGGGLDGARQCVAVDLDRDGDLDLAAVGRNADEVVWFANDGSPEDGAWAEHTIDLLASDPGLIMVADLDRDGDADLVVASDLNDNAVVWYANDGTPADGGWTKTAIDGLVSPIEGLQTADLDGDGDLDVVAAGSFGVQWYENSDPTIAEWTLRPLDAAVTATDVDVVDLDRDGDLDVLATRLDGSLLFFENDGTPAFGPWTGHALPSTANRLDGVEGADLDGDGDLDVAATSTSDGTLMWYESDGTPSDGGWTEHPVSDALDTVRKVESADLDQDGDLDLTVTDLDTDRIVVFLNDGSPVDGGWVRHESDSTVNAPLGVILADLDEDGDLDVATAANYGDAVQWAPNRGGQLAVAAVDLAPATAGDGEVHALLEIAATHRGRSGDRRAELTGFAVAFEDGSGVPFSTADAEALLTELTLWLDDGSGIFEPGADTLVSSVAELALDGSGVQQILVPIGDPTGRVPALQSRTWFVVAELAANASQQTPNAFRLVHRADLTTATDPDATPLSLEDPLDTPSGTVAVVSPGLPFIDGFESGDTSAWSATVP